MNRTSLSVVAMAVGAVLLLGLYNIYKPQTKALVGRVFSKMKINHLEPKVYHFDGLNYTADRNGNIEILNGTVTQQTASRWNKGYDRGARGLLHDRNAPQNLQNARTVKLDWVNVKHVNSLRGMFASDHNLRSVDLGSDFKANVNAFWGKPPHQILDYGSWGASSMFQDDPNLTDVNLGSFHLDNDTYTVSNIFQGDRKLQMKNVHGYITPAIRWAYKYRDSTTPD